MARDQKYCVSIHSTLSILVLSGRGFMQSNPTIAVIGGTGDLGSGLARLWAAAGYPIVLGSRAKDKAEAVASNLASQIGAAVRGDDNRAAAQAADIIVLCVPYS